MACHTHECDRCAEHYLCSAPMERNFDGWPDPVCVTRLEASEQFRQCTECNAGRLPCDQCDGQRRGEFNHDLGMVICDNCLTNMAEAAHERNLAEFYGGSTPQTIGEQYQAAAAEKRRVR